MTWAIDEDPPPVEAESIRSCIPGPLRDRLALALRELVESPEAAPFAVPVDVEDYKTVVPVPMDLGLILRRLEKVRRFCAESRAIGELAGELAFVYSGRGGSRFVVWVLKNMWERWGRGGRRGVGLLSACVYGQGDIVWSRHRIWGASVREEGKRGVGERAGRRRQLAVVCGCRLGLGCARVMGGARVTTRNDAGDARTLKPLHFDRNIPSLIRSMGPPPQLYSFYSRSERPRIFSDRPTTSPPCSVWKGMRAQWSNY